MMTCVDVMYQPGLSSCFPSFSTNAYQGISPYQPASISCSSNSAELLKKHGTTKAYSDRFVTGSSRVADLSTSSSIHDLAAQHCSRNAPGFASSALMVSPIMTKVTGAAEEEKPVSTQYLSPTSTVLIYYNGNSTSAVDIHFNRSLGSTNQFGKGSIPMTSRNLPASFWNPNPIQAQPPAQSYPNLSYHSYPSTSNDYTYGDPYYPSSFHPASFQHQSFPQSDPWNYAAAHFNSAAAAQNLSRAAAMQASADRFSYNPILFPNSTNIRSSRLDVSASCKTTGPWTAHSVFASEMPHYGPIASDYESSFSGKASSSKDMYWH